MLALINVMSPEGGFKITSTIGLTWGGVFATVFLILLLSSKEIISASTYYDEITEYCLDVPILPVLLVFFAIVVFKTIEILYP